MSVLMTDPQLKCRSQGRPPGSEIYRDDSIQIWEVDGKKSKV